VSIRVKLAMVQMLESVGASQFLRTPKGVKDISRGLSPRKPPVNSSESSHPEGMPEDQPKTEMRPQ